MNADPYSGPDKKARHKSISRLRSFALFENEELGKNSVRTKAEERRHGFMSCCFVWARVRNRIRVSIHKEQDMGSQPDPKLNPVSAR